MLLPAWLAGARGRRFVQQPLAKQTKCATTFCIATVEQLKAEAFQADFERSDQAPRLDVVPDQIVCQHQAVAIDSGLNTHVGVDDNRSGAGAEVVEPGLLQPFPPTIATFLVMQE